MGTQQLRSQGDEYSVDRERGMMPPKEKLLYEQREFPPVVQETVLPRERKEIQNVIHREVIIPEVHRITQPYFEKTVIPEVIQNRELPPVFHETSRGQGPTLPPREVPQSTRQQLPTESQVVEKPPIIVENVKKVVTTEIQPVIYREVIEPVIMREMRPSHERFVEPPMQQNVQQMPQVLQPTHHAHTMPYHHHMGYGAFPFWTPGQQQQQPGMLYPAPMGQSWFPWGHHHHQGFVPQQQSWGFPQQQQQGFGQQQFPQQQQQQQQQQSGLGQQQQFPGSRF